MTHKDENPQEHSNLRATRPIPRGPGTRYARETLAKTGLDPELHMARHSHMQRNKVRSTKDK